MLDSIKRISTIPTSLVDDIKTGKTNFYIGSNFLYPNRYEYIPRIMENFEKDRTIAEAVKKHKTIGSIAEISRRIVGGKKYENLETCIEEIRENKDLSVDPTLLNRFFKIPNLRVIITTIFDLIMERSVENISRNFDVKTGIDVVEEKIDLNMSDNTLKFFKLLGTLDDPDTLHLSDETMFDLRKRFGESENAKQFLNRLLTQKTFVIIGYESRDRYDKFFYKILDDYCYYLDKPITNKIYFVNDLRYDTYYGKWTNVKEEDTFVFDMSITSFINSLANFFE